MQTYTAIPIRRNISVKYSNKFSYFAVLFNRYKTNIRDIITFGDTRHISFTHTLCIDKYLLILCIKIFPVAVYQQYKR